MSKKRKFVADGVFFVELKLTRELAEDDYSGVEVQRIAAMVSYDMSWRVGAKNYEVVVSGKLRGQRAKSMKFKDGYMISSGQPIKEHIDSTVRHFLLRQGVLGIKVKIMLDWIQRGSRVRRTLTRYRYHPSTERKGVPCCSTSGCCY